MFTLPSLWASLSVSALHLASPGTVVVETAIPCPVASRLPCAGDRIRRAGLLYAGRDGRAYVAVTPALADEEARDSRGHSFSLEGTGIELRRVTGDFAADLDVYEVADPGRAAGIAARPEASVRADFDPERDDARLEIRGGDGRSEARWISARSDRTFVPALEAASEIRAAAALPFSRWAGAGVRVAGTGEVIGIAGAEFLELRPGRATRWLPGSDPAGSATIAVVIPEGFVRSQVERLIVDPAPYVRRIDSACYEAAGIRACERCDLHAEGEPPAAKDFPVGGANGNGVGGILTSGRRCKLRFASATGAATAALPPVPARWFRHLRQLGEVGSLEAWYSLDEQGAAWILSSAAEFFHAVFTGDSRVPIQRVGNPYPAGSAASREYDAAEAVGAAVFDYLVDGNRTEGPQLTDFLAQLNTLARLSQSDASAGVPVDVLRELDRRRELFWWLITHDGPRGEAVKRAFTNFVAIRAERP